MKKKIIERTEKILEKYEMNRERIKGKEDIIKMCKEKEEEKHYDWKELLKEGNEYEEILKWSAKLKKHRPYN